MMSTGPGLALTVGLRLPLATAAPNDVSAPVVGLMENADTVPSPELALYR